MKTPVIVCLALLGAWICSLTSQAQPLPTGFEGRGDAIAGTNAITGTNIITGVSNQFSLATNLSAIASNQVFVITNGMAIASNQIFFNTNGTFAQNNSLVLQNLQNNINTVNQLLAQLQGTPAAANVSATTGGNGQTVNQTARNLGVDVSQNLSRNVSVSAAVSPSGQLVSFAPIRQNGFATTTPSDQSMGAVGNRSGNGTETSSSTTAAQTQLEILVNLQNALQNLQADAQTILPLIGNATASMVSQLQTNSGFAGFTNLVVNQFTNAPGSVPQSPSTGLGTVPQSPSTGAGTTPQSPSTGQGTTPQSPSTGLGTTPQSPSTGQGGVPVSPSTGAGSQSGNGRTGPSTGGTFAAPSGPSTGGSPK
jgi:hypothetical protein